MNPLCFVGFDTSNYTTSCAVCTMEGEVIANIKAPLPVKNGECGLRQSDAVFAHVRNLPTVTEKLREAIKPYRVAAVGVSAKPRNAEDSYMPCFLSGVAATIASPGRNFDTRRAVVPELVTAIIALALTSLAVVQAASQIAFVRSK